MVDTILHRWLRVPYPLYVRQYRRTKRPRATVLFIHGIGNSGDAWQEVIAGMPSDVRVIAIDLLGFGSSPRPSWAMYDAKTQARSVLATYLKLGITTPVIVVGHSLGALVAIEITKRYPLLVKSLVLCSPPLYDTATSTRLLPSSSTVLRQLYAKVQGRPEEFVQLAALAMKYNLVNSSFNVTTENIESYMATLEASIVNQTAYHDAYELTTPTIILRGSLDPFVVTKNLKRLTKANPSVTLRTVAAGHEVKGLFVPAVIKAVVQHLPKKT